ncbi:MAG: sensor histidine kinase [Deltaproteobacteria bacterium]|nr:sensor histidine kinase [Deltaproteobacteria bacterium]
MKIHLPNSAFLGNIDPFLRSFGAGNPDFLEITANKKWISLHPVVLAMVAALGLTVKPENIFIEKLEAKSKHYLERIGLFKLLGLRSDIIITEHEPAGRFIPLTRIGSSEELSRFIVDMVPLLHLKPDQAEPIKYVVSELVRNVFEHSSSKAGAIICAQFYKKSNIIRIGIVDTGIGIKKSIGASYKISSDIEAIKLALTPGITGTTSRIGGTEFNAGAGLFFIKSIAKSAHDFFILYSGNAMYKLLTSASKPRLYIDPFRDRHSLNEELPYWQGTVVGIDISLGQKQEFSQLLDFVRDAYVKAISEQKKAKYKKAKFI